MAEKNHKREDILSSARALFKEKGFHNTRVEEIATKAGVGKGTVYEYFKNKQDIFEETCVEYITLIHKGVEDISCKDISFKEKIILLFNEQKRSMDLNYEKNPIDFLMSYKNVISEKILKTLFNNTKDMHKIIIKIIDQGKEEGVVIKSIHSEVISCSIIGTMHEYINLKMYEGNEINENDVIINLLLQGFGVK